MRQGSSKIVVVVLIVAQVLICNYFNLSQFVMLTFLPVIIFCMPVNIGTIKALIQSFLIGIAVDFFADGILGMTTAALLPVALLRKPIITLVFGKEVLARSEDITMRRQGLFKMNIGIVLSTALFLLIYLYLDDAGLRPFWFNLARFTASLAASSLVSLFIAALVTDEEKTKWR